MELTLSTLITMTILQALKKQVQLAGAAAVRWVKVGCKATYASVRAFLGEWWNSQEMKEKIPSNHFQ